MSQNIVTIDPVSILITVFNVLLLLGILRFFLFKPVNKVLDERAAQIQNDRNQAEAAQAKADEALEKYNKQLAGIKALEADTLRTSQKKASDEYVRILAEANERAQDIVTGAEKKAEIIEKNKMEEADRKLAQIVTHAAAKIAATSSSDSVNSGLYDEFLNKAGDKSE